MPSFGPSLGPGASPGTTQAATDAPAPTRAQRLAVAAAARQGRRILEMDARIAVVQRFNGGDLREIDDIAAMDVCEARGIEPGFDAAKTAPR